MPVPIVEQLGAVCDELIERGVPKHAIKELVGKIRTGISTNEEAVWNSCTGHFYELFKWYEYVKRGHALHDPKNVGDTHYSKPSSGPQPRVGQLKFSMSSQVKGVQKNAAKAVSQLAGKEGETPPADAIHIVDVVTIQPLSAFGGQQGVEDYAKELLDTQLGGKDAKLKITFIDPANPLSSDKMTVDVSNGTATTRLGPNKHRGPVFMSVYFINEINEAVADPKIGPELVKSGVRNLWSRL